MKWPPDFSQRNNTSEYTSRLLSVNLPALQIPISLPLICSSALLVDFSNDRMECLAHTNVESVFRRLLRAVEVNYQHLVDVVVIGAFDMVTTQDGPCGSVIYVQTIHNTNYSVTQTQLFTSELNWVNFECFVGSRSFVDWLLLSNRHHVFFLLVLHKTKVLCRRHFWSPQSNNWYTWCFLSRTASNYRREYDYFTIQIQFWRIKQRI